VGAARIAAVSILAALVGWALLIIIVKRIR
jgi:hypothetical protein